jgi:hypothetical protein
VLALLEEQAPRCPEAGLLEKVRTIGYLAGVILKVIGSGNLAAR